MSHILKCEKCGAPEEQSDGVCAFHHSDCRAAEISRLHGELVKERHQNTVLSGYLHQIREITGSFATVGDWEAYVRAVGELRDSELLKGQQAVEAETALKQMTERAEHAELGLHCANQIISETAAERDREFQRAVAAEAKLAEAEKDTARINILQEEITDTIYLDDGRIIDVKGQDVRKAIDKFAAMNAGKEPNA